MSNIDKLTFGEIKDLIALFSNKKEEKRNCMVNKYWAVRTHSSGVHMGELVYIDGAEVLLKNARRLWKWEGAFTLSEVSKDGINSKESKISCIIDKILLTNVIEVLPASDKAIISFNKCK